MRHTMVQLDAGEPAEELRYFVSVESDLHLDLGRYYEARFEEYFASRPDENVDEKDDE